MHLVVKTRNNTKEIVIKTLYTLNRTDLSVLIKKDGHLSKLWHKINEIPNGYLSYLNDSGIYNAIDIGEQLKILNTMIDKFKIEGLKIRQLSKNEIEFEKLKNDLKNLRTMKKYISEYDINMCFEIGFYDNKGNISISLQTQSCRNIIKQLMEMSDLEQLQFIENIKNINVKRKVLQDMDIVLKNYNKLLDDIYDEEEFRHKKYGAHMGLW